MRACLTRLLGDGARVQSSYLPGRCGFVVTSPRELPELRALLRPRWATRLYPLHLQSGRFFIEPKPGLLATALQRDNPELWWTSAHDAPSVAFFSSARAERLRRLQQTHGIPGRTPPSRGFRQLRDLAMRLEALHLTPRPDKHWRGLGESFDELWARVPLHKLAGQPLLSAIVDHLGRCRQAWPANA